MLPLIRKPDFIDPGVVLFLIFQSNCWDRKDAGPRNEDSIWFTQVGPKGVFCLTRATPFPSTKRGSVLQKPIDVLNLSRQSYTALRCAGIDRILVLTSKSRGELLGVTGLGRQSLLEVSLKLKFGSYNTSLSKKV